MSSNAPELELHALSERTAQHKLALISLTKPPVCIERALAYTEIYRQQAHQPLVVRRALALAHHLRSKSIWIQHDELIADI